MLDKDAATDRTHYRRYEECGFVYGPDGTSRVRPEVELFRDWVPRDARLLDLGCGDGAVASRLAEERGARVSGIEIDPAGVEVARSRGVTAIVGDLDEGLPFADGSFDVALINVTLHMVYRPRFVLEEALRVAPRVIITFPNFGFWIYRLELAWGGRFPRHSLYGYEWYDTRHIHLFSTADLRDLCSKLGVRVVAERHTGLKNRKPSSIARLWPNLLGRITAVMVER